MWTDLGPNTQLRHRFDQKGGPITGLCEEYKFGTHI